MDSLNKQNEQALKDLKGKYADKDKAKDDQLKSLNVWYNNALENKNFEFKEMSDKHKGTLSKLGDDHSKKVEELNDAHDKSSQAKDKIIDDLTTKLKLQSDEDGAQIDSLTMELARLKKKNQNLTKRITTLEGVEEELEKLREEYNKLKNTPPPPPPDNEAEIRQLRKKITE